MYGNFYLYCRNAHKIFYLFHFSALILIASLFYGLHSFCGILLLELNLSYSFAKKKYRCDSDLSSFYDTSVFALVDEVTVSTKLFCFNNKILRSQPSTYLLDPK